jgi:uncharacterized cupin superfamily protein
MVLEGEFDFTIGGETTRLKKGDFYIIPGGVEHGVVTLDGPASALYIFSPPRREQDLKRLARPDPSFLSPSARSDKSQDSRPRLEFRIDSTKNLCL